MRRINSSELRSILSNTDSKVFLYGVTDPNVHDIYKELSYAYVRTNNAEYFTSFNHVDFEKDSTDDLTLNNCITHNIKCLLHMGVGVRDNCKDYMFHDSDFSKDNETQKMFKFRLWGISDITSIIPLYTSLDSASETSKEILTQYQKWNETPLKTPFRDSWRGVAHLIMPKVFKCIETAGLKVDADLFLKTFGADKSHLISDGYVYTNYNYFTPTTRPSNSFGGVNFAALNKSDDSRKCFISRYGSDGILLNLDFKAYHLHLIAKEIGIDIPKDAHLFFGQKYFNTTTFTREHYEESKKITFKNLYGSSLDDICRGIDFFEEVEKLKERVYEEYIANDYKLTITDYHIPTIKMMDYNKSKVFNYYIQYLETDVNIGQLIKLGETNYPILYTYDSFVFDILRDDQDLFIDFLNTLLEYPFKIEAGDNLKEMITIFHS